MLQPSRKSGVNCDFFQTSGNRKLRLLKNHLQVQWNTEGGANFMKSNFPAFPEPCVVCVCVCVCVHAILLVCVNASSTNVGKSWHTLINKAT